MTVGTAQVPAYRTFRVRVARLQRLGPTFLRVTFTGADLQLFGTTGPDQRIKVLLPVPGRGLLDRPVGPDWYGEWRALPAGRRPPIRTYTVRALRSDPAEVDVDFLLHGATGPASAWAERARPGDAVVLVGPDVRHAGPAGGAEWRPPQDAARLLLAGDETAVPAICAIVESLTAGPPTRVLLEVPEPGDVLALPPTAGVEVSWLPRRGNGTTTPRGLLLTRAVLAALTDLDGDLVPAGDLRAAGEDTGPVPDDALVWDVPEDPPGAAGVYAWLAGEAGTVAALRRLLVREIGIPRTSVAFMGYWREGAAGG